MAYIMHMNFRHNLSKTFKIVNKLAEQQVRYLPRWAHRHPIRILNEDNTTTSESSYVKKLKIERESILHVPVKEENQLKNENKELNREHEFPLKSEQEAHFTVESSYHVSDHLENENVKPSKKTKDRNEKGIKPKTKKERKEEKKKEMKMNKLIDSATTSGVPLYTKLSTGDPKLSKFMLIAKSKNKKVKRSHIVLEGRRLIKDAVEAGYMPEHVFFSRVSDAANLGLPDGINLYKVPYKEIELWSDVSTPPGIMGFLRTPDVDKKHPGKDALPLTIICDSVRDPGNLGAILRGAAGVGCQKVILTKGCVDLWEPKVLRSGAGAHFRTPVVSDVEWEDVESHIGSEASIFLADSNILSLSPDDEDETSGKDDMSYNSPPLIPYFAADYVNCDPIVLVIGGETEGLSVDSFRLARERAGVRINIPLSNCVDSLNSGTAVGIIVFEIKRQFLNKLNKDSAEEIEMNARGM